MIVLDQIKSNPLIWVTISPDRIQSRKNNQVCLPGWNLRVVPNLQLAPSWLFERQCIIQSTRRDHRLISALSTRVPRSHNVFVPRWIPYIIFINSEPLWASPLARSPVLLRPVRMISITGRVTGASPLRHLCAHGNRSLDGLFPLSIHLVASRRLNDLRSYHHES